MKFATVLTCMDGRIQRPVYDYLNERFNAPWIDTITETGIVSILSGCGRQELLEAIFHRLGISVSLHGSNQIAIVAHHDCAANKVSDETQIEQLAKAQTFIQSHYPKLEVITLWVNAQWEIEELLSSNE
jgi:carbonic anhydrase